MKTCTCHWGLVYSNGFGKAACVGSLWKIRLNLEQLDPDQTQRRHVHQAASKIKLLIDYPSSHCNIVIG